MAAAATIDQARLEAFMGQFVQDMGAAATAPLVVIGDKLGLYKAMADGEPVTPAELATRTGCRERYLREWLCQQAASGVTWSTRPAPSGSRRSKRSRLPMTTARSSSRAPSSCWRRSSRTSPTSPSASGRAKAWAGMSTTTTCSRGPSGSSAPAIREPGGRVAAVARRRRREAARGRAGGRHRLRPRGDDDSDGRGVPRVHVRRLRLPRSLDRSRPPRR